MITYYPNTLITVPKKLRNADYYTITAKHHIIDSQVDKQWQDIYVYTSIQDVEEHFQSLSSLYEKERQRDKIRRYMNKKDEYKEFNSVDIHMYADFINYDGVSASVDRTEILNTLISWAT